MDGDVEIPVFDVDLDQDPLLRWKAIAAAPELTLRPVGHADSSFTVLSYFLDLDDQLTKWME